VKPLFHWYKRRFGHRYGLERPIYTAAKEASELEVPGPLASAVTRFSERAPRRPDDTDPDSR